MSPPNYTTSFMPLATGWLRRYLEAMVAMNSEMPLPFHYLSAACVLGHMLGMDHARWVKLGMGVEVFPNVSVLLLSPAGKCRRGEGTKFVMKMARDAGCNVFEGKATPEGLADELKDNPNTILYSEELSTLISRREHQSDLIPFLTKALLVGKGQMDWRTRGAGKKITVGPFNLSFLGTTAPSWFVDTMPAEAYDGGFMSRLLVCHLEERDTFHIDMNAEGDYRETLRVLAGELVGLVGRMPVGHIKGSAAANKWIKEFYPGNEAEIIEDSRMEPHRNRRPANLLRLGMIIACSEGRGEIDEGHVETAHGVLKYLEPTMHSMYAGTDNIAHDVGRAETKVLARLRSCGGEMEHKEMVQFCGRHVKGGMRSIRDLLEGLCEKGLVKKVNKPFMGPNTWPPMGWQAGGE